MKIQASLLAGLIAAAPGAALMAQDTVEVATDPVGYVSVDLTAASDTQIALPMHRAPVFQGIPASIDGNEIAFDEGVELVPEAQAYFIAVRSGSEAGLRATVINFDGNVLTVDADADLSGVATGEGGDSIQVIPHWTLASLFPEDLGDGTQVLVFDRGQSGINLAASEVFEFDSAGNQWVDAIFQTPAGDTVIHQTESIIVREGEGIDFNLVMAGSVPMFAHRDILSTVAADTAQDLAIGFSVPAPVTLANSGLGSEGDQLLVPNNDATGVNKAAAAVYEYSNGAWIDAIFQTPVGDEELVPGVGYTYRKAATAAPESVVWSHTPTYLD